MKVIRANTLVGLSALLVAASTMQPTWALAEAPDFVIDDNLLILQHTGTAGEQEEYRQRLGRQADRAQQAASPKRNTHAQSPADAHERARGLLLQAWKTEGDADSANSDGVISDSHEQAQSMLRRAWRVEPFEPAADATASLSIDAHERAMQAMLGQPSLN